MRALQLVDRTYVACTLAISTLLNVGLVRRLSYLPPLHRTDQNDLKAGQLAPPLAGSDLTGRTLTIAYNTSASSSLVYFWSPTCGACRQNASPVASLAGHITKSGFRVIGVAAERDRQALTNLVNGEPEPFDTLLIMPDTQRAYHFRALPTTVLVSTSGVILHVWYGRFDKEIALDLAAYFGLNPTVRQDGVGR